MRTAWLRWPPKRPRKDRKTPVSAKPVTSGEQNKPAAQPPVNSHPSKLILILVVAALQCRAIVIRTFIAGCLIFRSRTPQTRLPAFLFVYHLAAVLECCQSRLHCVEFRCRNHVLGTGRQDARNLLLRLGDAVWRLRVSRESFRQRPWLLLLFRLHLLEETDKCVRIVTRFVHVLQPEVVRLRLKAALEGQEGHRESETRR